MAPPTLVTSSAAFVIMLGWVASIAIGAIQRDWTPLTITTPLMMLLAGYAFGIQIIRRQKNGK